jgi:rhodanese-related sulfurtransferase
VWVVAALVFVFVLYKILYREWVLHSLRMARIKPEELYSSLNANPENYFVLDLRSHLDLKELPFKIPGAVHMLPEEIEMRHPEIPRDRDVVVYCACPNETSSSKMALRLRKKGILKIRPLLGGIVGWRYQEFPVEEFSL